MTYSLRCRFFSFPGRGLFAASLLAGASAAMACGPETYLGATCLTANTFCPRGTLDADGRQLSIAQNTALFSLLGNRYGGDGRTTFSLPDLRGKVAAKGMRYCIVSEGIYPSRP